MLYELKSTKFRDIEASYPQMAAAHYHVFRNTVLDLSPYFRQTHARENTHVLEHI